MPSDAVEATLRDILRHIALAEQFAVGYDWSRLHVDTKTVYAVIRCLEIISEASRRLPDDLKERPACDWLAPDGCRRNV